MIKIAKHSGNITRIGVISDTHIPTRGSKLPVQIYSVFEGVQLILHAGDMVDEKVLLDLKALAPVEAVAGNMDPYILHHKLGRAKLVRLDGLTLGLVHGDAGGITAAQRARSVFNDYKPQAVIFGHTHMPLCREEDDNLLLFNPGSAVDPRGSSGPTCGILILNKQKIAGKIIYLKKTYTLKEKK